MSTNPMLPNSGLMLRGINILKYSPLDPTAAGSFSSQQVYDVTFVDSSDGDFQLPKVCSYVPNESTNFQAFSNIVRTAADFSNAFSASASVGVDVDGGAFGTLVGGVGGVIGGMASASFSASAGYAQTSRHTSTSLEQTVISTASVTCWNLSVMEKAPLNEDFINAVNALPTTINSKEDTDKYIDFLNQYGTHAITQAVFGGIASQSSYMSEKSIVDMNNENIDVNAAGSASLAISLSVAVQGSLSSHQEQQFAQAVETQSANTAGGINNINWEVWVPSVMKDPVPVQLKVVPIYKLFANSSKINNAKEKEKNIEDVMMSYVEAGSPGMVLTTLNYESPEYNEYNIDKSISFGLSAMNGSRVLCHEHKQKNAEQLLSMMASKQIAAAISTKEIDINSRFMFLSRDLDSNEGLRVIKSINNNANICPYIAPSGGSRTILDFAVTPVKEDDWKEVQLVLNYEDKPDDSYRNVEQVLFYPLGIEKLEDYEYQQILRGQQGYLFAATKEQTYVLYILSVSPSPIFGKLLEKLPPSWDEIKDRQTLTLFRFD